MILNFFLNMLNIKDARLTTRSFRIGSATEAARIGLEESKIKKLGRWKSSAFKSYVWPNLLF